MSVSVAEASDTDAEAESVIELADTEESLMTDSMGG
jgi:hypothetical protein